MEADPDGFWHLKAASKELAMWLESIPLAGIDDLEQRLKEVDRACKESLPAALATAIDSGEARVEVQAVLGLKDTGSWSSPRFAPRGGQRTIGKKPDERQLADIRARGTFENGDEDDKSAKPDVWRVSRLLQTGTEVRRGWYYALLVTAVDQIWVQPSNRIFGSREPSVASGLRHVSKGLTGLANGLVGLKLEGFNAYDADQDILRDRKAACRASDEPPLDPRLFEDKTREFLRTQWARIAETRASAWATREESPFVEETIRQVREKHVGDQEVSEEVLAAEVRALGRAEEARRLAAAVSSDSEIEKHSPGLGPILARHVSAAWALSAAIADLRIEQQQVQIAQLEELKKTHPVLVHVDQWKSGKLARAVDTWRQALEWRPLENAEAIVGAIGAAEARLFAADKAWCQEKLRALITDAAARPEYKYPLHRTSNYINIWLPKNYWVDVFRWLTPQVIDSWRAHELPRHPIVDTDSGSEQRIAYALRTYDEVETTTDQPFWRFRLFAQRTQRNFKNGVLFFWENVWNGPLGLRALLSPFGFDVYKWSVNNQGVPYKAVAGRRPTLLTRLWSLWSHVFFSRTRFEAEPAAGLIGKGLARPFNLVWNYLVKGALGTALLCAAIPAATAAAVAASLALIVTSPGWAPGLALLEYLFDLLIFDGVTGAIAPVPRAIFWDIGLAGSFNIVASLVGAVLHPVIGACVYVGGGLGLAVVAAWDWLMFWGLLRWHARIPGADSFLCRRISGTGIAQKHYVQVAPAAVLLALRLELQKMLLEAHQDSLFRDANASVREATKIKDVLGDLGLTVDFPTGWRAQRTGRKLEDIFQRANELQGAIREEFDRRFRNVNALSRIDGYSRHQVRLTREDLDRTMPIAEDMVRRFMLEQLIPLKSKTGNGKRSAADFWKARGLTENDWAGLTRKLLVDAIADGVLTPLEEDTEAIHLQVDHVTTKEYVRMLVDDQVHDDLEVARVIEPRSKSAGAARLRWRDAGGGRGLTCGLRELGEESVQVWPVDEMDGLIEELSRYTRAGGIGFDQGSTFLEAGDRIQSDRPWIIRLAVSKVLSMLLSPR